MNYLEDASTCTATTEASVRFSDTACMTSESVDSYYDSILDDDSVIDETLIAGTTYYKSK